MKIVEPSVEVIFWAPEDSGTLEEGIEKAARTCYKSEGKIGEGTADKLIRKLRKSGHHAMLEFGYIMARIIADRGLSHELVRHRLASFAQESTRYCNYNSERFDSEISVIEPPGLTWQQRDEWHIAMDDAERHYMTLMKIGAKPQIARSVLPIGLKTEIVIGANPREWRHIFKMRCDKHAHPIIRSIMIEILLQCRDKYPAIFDDLFDDLPDELINKWSELKDKTMREVIMKHVVDKT
jgi:thymidylate synthase (FAD)